MSVGDVITSQVENEPYCGLGGMKGIRPVKIE